MSLKITNIEMEWTDTGANVLSTMRVHCPRCGVAVEANVRHLCGDKLPDPKKEARKRRALRPRGESR